ncbi:hypothetical protein LR48_Vigan04g090900 [Vigna angularis]|uniref:Pentatricopeptide repeat-containing protein n=1 Tax=Phaseolus angularis TaxID=3914 RepID=A0A0L9UDC2_PHAAN|nr:hypothetical protein LR48_Vigan04g090900 [Vigna angularis]
MFDSSMCPFHSKPARSCSLSVPLSLHASCTDDLSPPSSMPGCHMPTSFCLVRPRTTPYWERLGSDTTSCVVDLLAQGGRISEAYSLVTSLPIEANANLWGTLLGACKRHHEVDLGRIVANELFKIEANNIGNYIVLSNLFAADARWDRSTGIVPVNSAAVAAVASTAAAAGATVAAAVAVAGVPESTGDHTIGIVSARRPPWYEDRGEWTTHAPPQESPLPPLPTRRRSFPPPISTAVIATSPSFWICGRCVNRSTLNF